MKVSFDFDSTLDIETVQKYANELVQRQIEVWICTSRWEPLKAPNKEWNNDLFKVADSCGIKREHIIFCNYEDKYHHLKDKDFIFHMDDDNHELRMIIFHTDIVPIVFFSNKEWKKDCEAALFNHIKSHG
jgi:hypothetical protein